MGLLYLLIACLVLSIIVSESIDRCPASTNTLSPFQGGTQKITPWRHDDAIEPENRYVPNYSPWSPDFPSEFKRRRFIPSPEDSRRSSLETYESIIRPAQLQPDHIRDMEFAKLPVPGQKPLKSALKKTNRPPFLINPKALPPDSSDYERTPATPRSPWSLTPPLLARLLNGLRSPGLQKPTPEHVGTPNDSSDGESPVLQDDLRPDAVKAGVNVEPVHTASPTASLTAPNTVPLTASPMASPMAYSPMAHSGSFAMRRLDEFEAQIKAFRSHSQSFATSLPLDPKRPLSKEQMSEYKLLSLTGERHLLWGLDEVETCNEPAASNRRKTLVDETQSILDALEKVMQPYPKQNPIYGQESNIFLAAAKITSVIEQAHPQTAWGRTFPTLAQVTGYQGTLAMVCANVYWTSEIVDELSLICNDELTHLPDKLFETALPMLRDISCSLRALSHEYSSRPEVLPIGEFSFPFVRQIIRHLERLQRRVETEQISRKAIEERLSQKKRPHIRQKKRQHDQGRDALIGLRVQIPSSGTRQTKRRTFHDIRFFIPRVPRRVNGRIYIPATGQVRRSSECDNAMAQFTPKGINSFKDVDGSEHIFEKHPSWKRKAERRRRIVAAINARRS